MKAKFWLIYSDMREGGRNSKPFTTKECLYRWIDRNGWASIIAITETIGE